MTTRSNTLRLAESESTNPSHNITITNTLPGVRADYVCDSFNTYSNQLRFDIAMANEYYNSVADSKAEPNSIIIQKMYIMYIIRIFDVVAANLQHLKKSKRYAKTVMGKLNVLAALKVNGGLYKYDIKYDIIRKYVQKNKLL